jgi:hypothetical protein
MKVTHRFELGSAGIVLLGPIVQGWPAADTDCQLLVNGAARNIRIAGSDIPRSKQPGLVAVLVKASDLPTQATIDASDVRIVGERNG